MIWSIGDDMKQMQSKYYEYDWVAKGSIGPVISLGEGNTPLTYSKGLGVWIKHEEMNPTGCFKDRESAVVISKALELGYKKVVVVSSGNAALSTAAYAQKAGIVCEVYIPEKTTKAKKQLIKMFGGIIHEIQGFYEDVYRYVVDHPVKGAWNVTSGQNPWRVEGNKTIAYELLEQIGHVPDVVVVPAGNGGCLAGIWRGFEDLFNTGKTVKIPKMVGVQIKGADPLKKAIEQGKQWVNLGDVEDSVAEGIVAAESYCSPKAVEAITKSSGFVVSVTDEEIVEALGILVSKESLVTEPTSAAAFAGLKKLEINKQSEIVVINTGSGMKMVNEVMKLVNIR